MSKHGVSFITEVRVRYAETDAMKVVYHGNYLPYFEDARTNLFRNIGIIYTDIEKAGFYLVVLEAHVKYLRPAVYDDILQVKATFKELPALKLTVDYEITRKSDGVLLVTGQTVHAFVHAESGRPIRPPKEYFSIMQKYFQ
ncbi:MAG: thioesterase family protein [Bacteroidota bacterium]